jgi:hypothetical protein
MRLGDILRDPATGQLSHTKLWNNIVNAVLTWQFIDLHLAGRAGLEWMLAYAAIVGTVGVASKLVSLRFGAPSQPEAPSSTPSQPGGSSP